MSTAIRRLKRTIHQLAQVMYVFIENRLSWACFRHISAHYVDGHPRFKTLGCVRVVLEAIRSKNVGVHRVGIFKEMLNFAKTHIQTYSVSADASVWVPHPQRGEQRMIVIIQCFTRKPHTNGMYTYKVGFLSKVGNLFEKDYQRMYVIDDQIFAMSRPNAIIAGEPCAGIKQQVHDMVQLMGSEYMQAQSNRDINNRFCSATMLVSSHLSLPGS